MSDDEISYRIVVNDNSNEAGEDLIALKNIFSKQLPKMPREYIVRLVFDRRHISIAICNGKRVIGTIIIITLSLYFSNNIYDRWYMLSTIL